MLIYANMEFEFEIEIIELQYQWSEVKWIVRIINYH